MKNRLSHIDIRLLLALQALLDEQSVSRAADRLCVTQPAMSKTLGRLRDLLDDPLLTRSGTGLVLTPRAQALRLPLVRALNELEDLLAPTTFDPAEATGRVGILYSDTTSSETLLALCADLQQVAPQVQLELQNHVNTRVATVDQLELLRIGAVDFSISSVSTRDPDFVCSPLNPRELICWMRRGHPLAAVDEIAAGELFSYPRLVLFMTGYGEEIRAQFDAAAKQLNIASVPPLRTSSLLMAIELMLQSDALLIASSQLSRLALTRDKIIGRDLPKVIFENQAGLRPYLIQHLRTTSSPLHQWVRRKIIEIDRVAVPATDRTGNAKG